MPIYRRNTTSTTQNLLTSDGLLVSALVNGAPGTLLMRPAADTTTGTVKVELQIQVNGLWYSAGYGSHNA